MHQYPNFPVMYCSARISLDVQDIKRQKAEHKAVDKASCTLQSPSASPRTTTYSRIIVKRVFLQPKEVQLSPPTLHASLQHFGWSSAAVLSHLKKAALWKRGAGPKRRHGQ